MMPLSQTLLRRIFPAPHAAYGPGTLGDDDGGRADRRTAARRRLVDTAGWPWVFYINVPVAVVCAFFAWRMLAGRETRTERHPVDYVGLGLLIVWIGAMQIMLDKGKDLDWFSRPSSSRLAADRGDRLRRFHHLGADRRPPDRRPAVFRHRGFAAASIIMALAFGAFFSTVVLIPLWLQTNHGLHRHLGRAGHGLPGRAGGGDVADRRHG